MLENAQLEFARMENAHNGKCQNGNWTPLKMTKNNNPEKDKKIKFGKCQDGNCTPWKFQN